MPDQRELWNGDAGERWVRLQETLDTMLAPVRDAAIERADPRSGERVVDVGCGCGGTVLALARRVAPTGSVLGVDISGPMSARAKARIAEAGASATVHVGDAATYAFSPEHGLVFSAFGVMFFDDPRAAFTNLRRALRPGGRIVFVCWRPFEQSPYMRVPFEAVTSVVPPPPPAPEGAPGPFAFGDPERVRGILRASRLRDATVEPLDRDLVVGASVEEAAAFATELGPASRALGGAGEDDRARALEAIRAALRPYAGPDGAVRLGAAAWLVSARA